MRNRETEVLQIADAIEGELRRLDLWETHPPPPEAVMSEQPFCFDTLTFTQWLQWVLLARVRDMVANGIELPTHSDIHPLAEHSFSEFHGDSAELLQQIRRFDSSINRRDSS